MCVCVPCLLGQANIQGGKIDVRGTTIANGAVVNLVTGSIDFDSGTQVAGTLGIGGPSLIGFAGTVTSTGFVNCLGYCTFSGGSASGTIANSGGNTLSFTAGNFAGLTVQAANTVGTLSITGGTWTVTSSISNAGTFTTSFTALNAQITNLATGLWNHNSGAIGAAAVITNFGSLTIANAVSIAGTIISRGGTLNLLAGSTVGNGARIICQLGVVSLYVYRLPPTVDPIPVLGCACLILITFVCGGGGLLLLSVGGWLWIPLPLVLAYFRRAVSSMLMVEPSLCMCFRFLPVCTAARSDRFRFDIDWLRVILFVGV